MKYKKWIKWIFVIVLIILISVFFLLPVSFKDINTTSYRFAVNNYPEIVLQELNDLDKVEKWLQTQETPKAYTTSYSSDLDSLTFFKRTNQSINDVNQTVTKRISPRNLGVEGAKEINFDITHSKHSYKRILTLWLVPDGNIIATGGNANTSEITAYYTIDFSTTKYFENLFAKWEIFINGDELKDEYLIAMCKNFKTSVEDDRGRLLRKIE
jgi:hypothetical protein